MHSFQLFRLRVNLPVQRQLREILEPISSRAAIQSVLQSRPSLETRRGHRWHVGNLAEIDPNAIYFALGRTTRAHVELFDEVSHNFVETVSENAPYTHVVLDLHIQVCAIAAKPKLAPTQQAIARRLAELMTRSKWNQERHLTFRLDPIEDPEGLLQHIRSAFRIERFAVEFSRPNPWDVDKDFQAPMQKLLAEAEGRKGKTSLVGDHLDPQPLERLTRAAAAAGDNAEATLYPSETSGPIRRSLKGNPVILTEADLAEVSRMRGLAGRIRDLYAKVRREAE